MRCTQTGDLMTAEMHPGMFSTVRMLLASMRPPACAVHADRRSNDRGNDAANRFPVD